jgi:2-oxoglutarate ferredoxin oxidoreductase subunit delta
MPVTGWVEIDDVYCKGCGLCIWACPREVLVLDEDHLTLRGYHPARLFADGCTGCSLCALMCPEAAVTVYQEKPVRERQRPQEERIHVA